MASEASATPRRARIIANPISGRGRGEHAARALEQALRARGLEVTLHLTRARGDAVQAAASAAPEELLVAVGGDGTLGEVLQGVADPRRPVGLLPCGTANVLAHGLGLPSDVDRAVETLLGGRVQGLDVARVGTRLAHLVVGIGLDGRIVHALEERRRGPITKASYLPAVLRALRGYRPTPLRVWIDGQEWSAPAGLVWIANTRSYADLLRLAPDGRLDDGRWEVYRFPSGRLGEVLAAFLRGLVTHLPGGAVEMRRGRHVRVEASAPVPVQIDGDHGGTTPLELELLPQPFHLLVPRAPGSVDAR